jgi:hypothetical protein
MVNEVWSDSENDLIVASYFAMLAADISNTPYNKAENRRSLKPLLKNRTDGSIEFKHQNISAVLKGLGQCWISGYKPAYNFQASLEEAVVRHLDNDFDLHNIQILEHSVKGLNEASQIWVGPPPAHSNQPPPQELEQMLKLAKKFDVAGRDERNRKLGFAGEEKVLMHERFMLKAAGREDLSRKIRWVSQEDGDGAGYDIASYTLDGKPRLIEVKTTNGWERTPFYISKNELAIADERRDVWCLLRLWNFAREPKAFELYHPLDTHVSLTATAFQAQLH